MDAGKSSTDVYRLKVELGSPSQELKVMPGSSSKEKACTGHGMERKGCLTSGVCDE